MAEESVELPVISEETMSSSVEVRGHSAGKGSSENSNKKVVSRYLKPSTGSCHDICKYGREQAIGTKNRRSIPDRATRKKLYQSSKGGHGEIMISVSGLGASVDSKPANMSLAKLEKPVDSELQISDTSYSKKQESPIKSSDNKKQTRNEGLVKKKKTSLVKVKPSLLESGISSLARQETSSTAKEVKSSTESASKKVESPSKSTSRKVKTPSKSTSTKVETPSKSTLEEMETPSKSTLEEVETPSKSTSEEVETPSKSNSKKVKRPSESTSKKMGTGTPLKSTSNIKSSSKSTPRVETSSKSTAKMVKSPSKSSTLKDNGTELSPKSVTSLKPISVPGKITSLNSSESFGGQRNRDIKMEKVAVPSKAASRKSMKPLMAPLSPKVSPKRVQSINSKKLKSLKVVSQLKNQQIANARKVVPEELNDEEVEEKTLYVIEMESVNKTLQSDHNASYNDEPSLPQISTPNFASSSKFQPVSQEGQEESEYTTTKHEEDSVSRNHEEYMENGKTLEVVVKGKPKPRKGGIVYSEDKDDQMLKLKFRKGRMIENKVENNSPRKLKFRKTKVYQKAQPKADSQRKTFKRRDEACADNTGATPGPEHVVLRHQDKKDKKGSQGLFNNVIEETASKLAETRKSKVKALVGAFETVISLQDEKPSSNTAT
ncbi:PREDICTED: muscle M-line assembly protein unc-89-like isoform X5 [Lupinus angustifolius]|uniref:muscle M-line assembly protein unc-89-like isoform X5 n=1 Tax=Lupinus angustifolius TaxID=3871 RepID=UPI00092E447D|nr:PREDICTED: muscle M-line assembly protein unc-89-like isoform X5 [Lupinus angustifolius]